MRVYEMSAHFPGLADKANVAVVVYPQSLKSKSKGFYRSVGKRLIDVIIVLLAAPLVIAIVLALGAFIAKDGHNPFYSQKRVGFGGRIFTMWKLRTMVPQAEARLEACLAADPMARAEWDATQKLKNDPRITRVGQVLRRASIDELPQLWNVLIGDMSLVGPRPMMPEQQEMYPGQAYFALRPGVTGPWQVSDRNMSSFAARADFDDAYENQLSLPKDVAILYATVRVVINCTGF
jgi:exopolysaccharide production protein ExoY